MNLTRPDTVHPGYIPKYKQCVGDNQYGTFKYWQFDGYEETPTDDAFWDMVAYSVPLSQDDLDYIESRHQRFLKNAELS